MKNKPVIAVDIDEVLFPLTPDLIQYVDRKHKVKLNHDDFVKHDIREVWKDSPIELETVYEDYINQTNVAIAPIKGAKEALNKLATKYEIIVMTARDARVEPKTKDWLYSHFPDLFKAVHLLGNSRESKTFRLKPEVGKELGVSYLIDDHLGTILEAHSAGINSVIFGDYPWNQIDKLPEGVTRAKNWQEVLEYFDAQDR